MVGRRVLILGGTGEAVELASRLTALPGVTVITSLAGVTRNPAPPPGHLRSGGFGGVAGLADYLQGTRINAIVDATHPFASRISCHAAEAARLARIPLVHLLRPAWRQTARDIWHDVDSVDQAAAWLQASSLDDGAVIFLAIGRMHIGVFRSVSRFRYLIRTIDPPDLSMMPPRCDLIMARGPFPGPSEHELLRRRGVACLVTRNSGGSSGRSKITAARALAIPVVMIARPSAPPGQSVPSVNSALRLLAEHTGFVSDRA